MEHQEFYVAAKWKLDWDDIDFSKIPSEHVENLWNQYNSPLMSSARRLNFRKQNPELDEWLVRTQGYSPATGREGGTGVSQFDTQIEEIAAIRRRIEALK